MSKITNEQRDAVTSAFAELQERKEACSLEVLRMMQKNDVGDVAHLLTIVAIAKGVPAAAERFKAAVDALPIDEQAKAHIAAKQIEEKKWKQWVHV